MNKRVRTVIEDYAVIAAGSAIFALSVNWVFAPLHLVAGGFTGLEIIIKHLTSGIVQGGVPIWISNIALNLPVFIAAYILRGKEFVGKTLFSTAACTLFLWAIPQWAPMGDDMVISIIYGTVLSGVGIGLVFTRYATTGGTDMAGALIQLYRKHWHMTTIMGVLDVLIVVAGAVVFGLANALYAIVSIAGTTVISGRIQEGVRFAKSVYIISDKNDEIADYIDRELDRGVTYIEAIGYHTGQHRHMLYTVVNKKELGLLKYKVSRTDKNSFMIVGDVREVFGEGWQIPGKQMY